VGAVKVVDGLDPGVDGDVVVVEEGDEVGICFFDGAMAGDGGSLDGFVDVAEGDGGGVVLNGCGGVVGAVVVNDENFPGEVCGGLGIEGLYEGGEVVGSVVSADGNGELGRGHNDDR
jgi:hypothetical protein